MARRFREKDFRHQANETAAGNKGRRQENTAHSDF
jgi:hypothetical protein